MPPRKRGLFLFAWRTETMGENKKITTQDLLAGRHGGKPLAKHRQYPRPSRRRSDDVYCAWNAAGQGGDQGDHQIRYGSRSHAGGGASCRAETSRCAAEIERDIRRSNASSPCAGADGGRREAEGKGAKARPGSGFQNAGSRQAGRLGQVAAASAARQTEHSISPNFGSLRESGGFFCFGGKPCRCDG